MTRLGKEDLKLASSPDRLSAFSAAYYDFCQHRQKPEHVLYMPIIMDPTFSVLLPHGGGQIFQLREHAAFANMILNPGKLFSIPELIVLIWNSPSYSDADLKIVISHLRKKLDPARLGREESQYIKTVRDVGYQSTMTPIMVENIMDTARILTPYI